MTQEEETEKPSLLPKVQALPTPPTSLYPDSSLSQEEAQKTDLPLINYQIAALASCWPSIRYIEDGCKLALVISKLMRERREAMGLRYGPSSAESKRNQYLPID